MIKIFLGRKYFCKNVCYIEILVNFAIDSASEEADAASPDSTFVDGGLLSAEKVY